MPPIDSEIVYHVLSPLVGLPLSIARRASDMLGLHFGAVREVEITGMKRHGEKGTVAEYALHIQCTWRLEDKEKIITGRGDLYRLPETGEYFDDIIDGDTCYEFGKNLQDYQIHEVMQGIDPLTNSYTNVTNMLVVESIETDKFGGATICLSGGYKLAIFPSESKGEHWRLLYPETNKKHFVVRGTQMDFD